MYLKMFMYNNMKLFSSIIKGLRHTLQTLANKASQILTDLPKSCNFRFMLNIPLHQVS